ncbi:MAG: ribosome recycling factor [bacterium TMED6]|nr:MAG: ribosome recycling factor [bacterium TMED6]|tara:strand:+ start:399 stop:953 length:555 start_codon:yes stop_codon:yes gene_type:complete
MQQEIFSEAKNKMSKAIEHYKQEVSFIRTGRASTHILNPVKVDYYGTPTPLNNVANITIPEAQLISIQPFDPSSIELIEKAITESDIGLTPSNDGNIIRLNIPTLTEERRKELVKQVHKIIEDGKIAVRNIRRDANDQLKKLEKSHDLSEDNLKRELDNIQEITNQNISRLDEVQSNKEKEILI